MSSRRWRFFVEDILAAIGAIQSFVGDMRNIVAHLYWGVNARSLWDTAHKDLPPLIPLLKKILKETSD